MTMSLRERAEFVNGYTRVLISAWSDETFAQRAADLLLAMIRETSQQRK